MSDQLYEVAFSGQISEGADLNDVKAKVAKMFNADDAKLALLFSGKRVVIKKNIDQATADKYKSALNRAGAQCEISPPVGASASAPAASAPAATAVAATAVAATAAIKPVSAASAVPIETGDYGEVAPPPAIDPLGITASDIEDLEASIAPVGSELQQEYQEVETPEFDLSEFDLAPVGSELITREKNPDPPPPDTSGISMAEE
jgi:hypothetical protein